MESPRPRLPGFSDGARLFLLGFASLFLELLLIRFLAGSIWNLGYFPNLVLTAVFIGMGIGFTFHRHVPERLSPFLFDGSALVLLALVVYVTWFHPGVPGFTQWQADISGEVYFTDTPRETPARAYLPFVACMVGVIVTFGLVTQRTAKLFVLFRPLTAYTLDIAGSCSGIIVFMVMSWLWTPAFVWFIVFGLLCAAPISNGWRVRWVPLVACLVMAGIARRQDSVPLADPSYQGKLEVAWSPYQRVEYVEHNQQGQILVNGISHQTMMTESGIRNAFYHAIHVERRREGRPPYKNVLIVGAGSGNDVAAALMNQAEHVDAVEIDPAIAGIGRRHHPCRPYDDSRVHLVIDDGRAFMTRTSRSYDLILFALTDSLVKASSMSQLRLENYLFTKESAGRAYELLNPWGDVIFYNYYRRPWLVKKIRTLIAEGTGIEPQLVHSSEDFMVLRVRKGGADRPDPRVPASDTPTDDWPFLYLRERGIPAVYAWAMAGITALIAILMMVLQWSDRGHEPGDRGRTLCVKLAFVAMGIAFLLLETKGVIQFSLLFGTTWLNTSLVFLAVLGMVLGANWAAALIGKNSRLWVVFVLLLVSCLATLAYPLGNLLSIHSAVLRFAIASLMTFSPIFFANLLFSMSFREQRIAEHLFGWNLLGATLGGVAEYSSMAIGYNYLAILVAALYTIAFILLTVSRRGPSPAAARA
jgi:spermidine synthase